MCVGSMGALGTHTAFLGTIARGQTLDATAAGVKQLEPPQNIPPGSLVTEFGVEILLNFAPAVPGASTATLPDLFSMLAAAITNVDYTCDTGQTFFLNGIDGGDIARAMFDAYGFDNFDGFGYSTTLAAADSRIIRVPFYLGTVETGTAGCVLGNAIKNNKLNATLSTTWNYGSNALTVAAGSTICFYAKHSDALPVPATNQIRQIVKQSATVTNLVDNLGVLGPVYSLTLDAGTPLIGPAGYVLTSPTKVAKGYLGGFEFICVDGTDTIPRQIQQLIEATPRTNNFTAPEIYDTSTVLPLFCPARRAGGGKVDTFAGLTQIMRANEFGVASREYIFVHLAPL